MDTEIVNPEDLEMLESLPASHFIQRRAASKRSHISEFQVRLLARVTRMLVDATLATYSIRSTAELFGCGFERFTALAEYGLFIDTCYATGFVCRDLAPKVDLESVNMRPGEVVPTWSLPQARAYVHSLLRGERWADGWSSPIFEALHAGTLICVIEHLERNDSLYAPIS